MSDSSCWDWLLMAAAKWQPAGRQMEARGAADGSWRGGKWKPAGLHMAEAMCKGLGSGD
jgi:hypothetical protein